VLVVRHFFTTAADLLQVTIAFPMKIFSFSDKKKVLNNMSSKKNTITCFRQALLGCSMLHVFFYFYFDPLI